MRAYAAGPERGVPEPVVTHRDRRHPRTGRTRLAACPGRGHRAHPGHPPRRARRGEHRRRRPRTDRRTAHPAQRPAPGRRRHPHPGSDEDDGALMTGTNPRVAPDLVRCHAPKLADLTDDVLFADVWQRPDLSPRDRSLITVAALVPSAVSPATAAPAPAPSRTSRSPPSPPPTARLLLRSCSAGTSSNTAPPSPSPCAPSASPRTSTSSTSPSPPAELETLDNLDTGTRGGPEPAAVTLEAFGRDIPEA